MDRFPRWSCKLRKVPMGKLFYDSTLTVDFDDRVLAHLQIVIGAKLRRGESFYFSWKDDPAVGDGRSTIWLAPNIPLHYKYFGSRLPALNREWIIALSASSNSAGGLQIVPEPPANSVSTDAGQL
ncbi:hypothetical protein ABIE24_000076 [Mycetocola sp. 2940]